MVWCERSCHRNTYVKYESPISQGSQFMTKVKILKSRSNFKVKVTRSKLWNDMKGPCHKECRCEYKTPSSSGKKVMAKVTAFEK